MGTATPLDEITPTLGLSGLFQPMLTLAVSLLGPLDNPVQGSFEAGLQRMEAATAERMAISDDLEAWLRQYGIDRCGLGLEERSTLIKSRAGWVTTLEEDRAFLSNIERLLLAVTHIASKHGPVFKHAKAALNALEASRTSQARAVALDQAIADVLELEIDSHDMRVLKSKPFSGVSADDDPELRELLGLDG